MAKLFISHSSKDKAFVKKLAEDLIEAGHQPWLDEWEIKVGESIPVKIGQGIEESDFLAVVLSRHSVESGWVEREWSSKYWDEAGKNRVWVLPILLEPCNIPTLLAPKKYADCTKSYAIGFSQLLGAVGPVAICAGESPLKEIEKPKYTDLMLLIREVQDPKIPLSTCAAKILGFAFANSEKTLADFCAIEISGYPQDYPFDKMPLYRVIDVFASYGELNPNFIGWGGKIENAIIYMENRSEDFVPQKLVIQDSISGVEDRVQKIAKNSVMRIQRRSGDVNPKSKNPDVPIFLYGRPEAFRSVLFGIKHDLTNRLISLLPGSAHAP